MRRPRLRADTHSPTVSRTPALPAKAPRNGPAARRNHPRRRQKKRGTRNEQGSLNSRDEAPPAGGFHFTLFLLPFALIEGGCVMVRVGIAGIGFMGVTHYKALKHVEGAKVTAIFTRNPQKLAGDWQGVKGNLGEACAVEGLPRAKRR